MKRKRRQLRQPRRPRQQLRQLRPPVLRLLRGQHPAQTVTTMDIIDHQEIIEAEVVVVETNKPEQMMSATNVVCKGTGPDNVRTVRLQDNRQHPQLRQ